MEDTVIKEEVGGGADAPVVVAPTPAVEAPANQPLPLSAADFSDKPKEGYVPIMVIDRNAPQEEQARDMAEAKLKGLDVIYKEGSDDDAPAATEVAAGSIIPGEGEVAGEEAGEAGADVHPLAAKLFGTDTPAAETLKKATAPVREFFEKVGLGDADTVLAELTTFRTERTALQQKLSQAEQDLGYLAKLSPEAMNVVQMDLEKKDWKKEVIEARPHNLDYTLPFNKQEQKAILDTYAKGKVSDEQYAEFTSDEGDPKTKAYVEAVLEKAELLYGRDAEASTTYVTKQAEEAKTRHLAYTKSVDAAMQQVMALPGAAAHEKKIRGLLTPDAVLGMFFNPDGTLKPTAPEDLWLVSDRDAILGAKHKRLEREVGQKAMKDHLKRTPEKKVIPTGGAGTPVADNLTSYEKLKLMMRQRGY